MTLDELKAYLKGKGYSFSVEENLVGPTDEWTAAEQEQDCCAEVPDADPCVDDGKVEPFHAMTDELAQEIGYIPEGSGPTPLELLNQYEQTYGVGNVHLSERLVGPAPCGEIETTWVENLTCCEDPDELLKGSGSSTAAPDDTLTYRITSGTGELPVTWHVIGSGVTVAKTDTWSARANFDECFCDPVVIHATDTCLSVAPWLVSRTGGSWATIADESLSTPFGWFQDGSTSSFFLIGLNSDNTKVSTQHYWQAQYSGTEEVVCQTTMPGINTSPIVTPQDSQGYTKCESANIWIQLEEGFTNVWNVRYAIDSQATSEFTHTCQNEAGLEVDENNSLTTIADNSSGLISWFNGTPPFTITTSGQEFYVDSARKETEKQVTGRSTTVYAADSCGNLEIIISDNCGQSVIHNFNAADGTWDPIPLEDVPSWFRDIPGSWVSGTATTLCTSERGGYRVKQYWTGDSSSYTSGYPKTTTNACIVAAKPMPSSWNCETMPDKIETMYKCLGLPDAEKPGIVYTWPSQYPKKYYNGVGCMGASLLDTEFYWQFGYSEVYVGATPPSAEKWIC